MMVKIILSLLWVATSILEGCRDGFFYSYRMNSAKSDNYNMHWLFTSERGVILALICWIGLDYMSTIETAFFASSLALCFSFLHNGMYYWTRNKLDNKMYPKGWWDESTTSESTIEFGARARTVLASIGFAAIATMLMFN